MKISKKIIVSSLSTALGVSLVGAISGTVAWYQYNTAVRTSIIGMNVAETGVLQISAVSAIDGFRRDLVTKDVTDDTTITPITWATGANQLATGTAASPLAGKKAYKNPNAALNRTATNPGSYAEVYQEAAATDYIQYDVYLRAMDVANDPSPADQDGFNLVAKEVYLTNFTLLDVAPGTITEGMRVLLECYDDSVSATPDRYYLLSKTAQAGIALSGMLDCDNDGVADRVGGYEWQDNFNDVVTYGEAITQTTMIPSTLINAPAADGKITTNASKLIVTTPAVAGKASKVTVTIWMEGWHKDTTLKSTVKNVTATKPAANADVEGKYTDRNCNGSALAAGSKADGTSYYYTDAGNVDVPMWSGLNTDGAQFQLGMTFNVSSDAFK